MEYKTIIDFWFSELTPEQHFIKNDAVDERIKSFADVHTAVKNGENVEIMFQNNLVKYQGQK